MLYPSYTKLEQKAILHLSAAVAFNNGWTQNDKNLLNAIGGRFGFSNQDVSESIVMEREIALVTIKNIDSSKKRLISCLFMSAAMADGNMRMGKPQWEQYFDYANECGLPMDIPFNEALDITHQYLGC